MPGLSLFVDPSTRRGGSAAAQASLSELLSRAFAGGKPPTLGALPSAPAAPSAAALPAPGLNTVLSTGPHTPAPLSLPAVLRGIAGLVIQPAGQMPATAAGPGSGASAPESAVTVIVFLDPSSESAGMLARAQALLKTLGAAAARIQIFEHLSGFAVQLSSTQSQRLRALAGVRSVEADVAVKLQPPIPGRSEASTLLEPGSLSATALLSYTNATAASGEILPWGVRAVWQGEDISLKGNIASDTYAFVIDSGVLASSGDLNLAANSSWHRSWISSESAFTDGNGHGSHVAGTIAALANGAGVVGVAPGAQVVSLKVFDSSGGGASYTSIIDAINHAVGVINGNGLDKNKVVINMSLGGSFSSSLDSAVRNAANQGIRFALAAGNEGRDADDYSPAAAGDHANVFTVSAVDSAYRMTSWSNWDRLDSRDAVDDVDVAAPGASVLSYYQNGQLAYLSGTSMASPHVAGLLLMGGVNAGDTVTPYVSGTADRFAWGVTASAPPPPDPNGDLVLWGTTASDTITGGSGQDRLSGVLASGTSAASMGAGQIDVLTGNAGIDTFVLGDSRGVFYDDRSANRLGSEDYARIQDFVTGVDKLQLRQGSYLYTVTAGNLSLYWDRNGSGRLENSGRSQDELIGVVQGLSALGSADILWA